MKQSKTWILTDVDNRIYVESCAITDSEAGSGRYGWSIKKTRLKGGLSDGVDIIEVDNGRLSFTLVPTRGFGFWRGACDGVRLGWDSPVKQPVNPMFINTMENNGTGWLKGMNECMVRCGLNSNGAPGIDRVDDGNGNIQETPLTLHGTIATIPAKYVEVTVIPGEPDELIVRGIVEDGRIFASNYRLETTFSTFAGSRELHIHDDVTNWGDSPADLELLYHCNFGTPILEKGAVLESPSLEVIPRTAWASEDIQTWQIYKAPEGGFFEQVHFHTLAADKDGKTMVMLRNSAADKAAYLKFDRRQLPCFIQWKNTVGEHEGYVSGLEPATNLPNPKAFERENGRVLILAPGQTYPVDLTIGAATDSAQVQAISSQIKALMPAGAITKLYDTPQPGWAI